MLPASLETSQTVKMTAVIEQWEGESGCHTDNTVKYLLLMLFKLGMDAMVFHLCCQTLSTCFLSMCSLSIILADLVTAYLMAIVLFLGAESSLVSPCFILANASATYGVLPLPMMFLGLLDYCLEGTYLCNQRAFCKLLRNAVLTLLVWMLAVIYSFCFVKAELIELEYATGIKALVCNVEESTVITSLTLGLFAALLCMLLPFWSRIPQWVKEADRLSEARKEQHNQSSVLFISTSCTDTKSSEENDLEETIWLRPPLWISLTLGFGMFWMPYLAVSVACLALGFGVPAYITVNLLWLECTNSLLVGMMFWAKSETQEPYSRLPENVCLWHIYWHLSKGTQQQQLPVAEFNPSKGKRNTLFYV
ncbi:probable G-protein coupled receptor 160 [Pempheris klunzingeri]|uniref:probable G-protein coupled receptor 160 n=1 Tax=Pempheris klunzingeri TaxID=3127111 RepID=UPI00397F5D6F